MEKKILSGVIEFLDDAGGFIRGEDEKRYSFKKENLRFRGKKQEANLNDMVQFFVPDSQEEAELPEVPRVIHLGFSQDDLHFMNV